MTTPLNLVKLCVGCDSIADLKEWIASRKRQSKTRPYRHAHITRMVPKRADDLKGGSLYWVIRGQISCRQKLMGVEPFVDKQGVGRCRLVLDPRVVSVAPRPYRAFQGWRYFEDPPADLRAGSGEAELPEAMRRELRELGLL